MCKLVLKVWKWPGMDSMGPLRKIALQRLWHFLIKIWDSVRLVKFDKFYHFLIKSCQFYTTIKLEVLSRDVLGWSKSGTLGSERVHREKWGSGLKMGGVLKVDILWKLRLDSFGPKWKSFKMGQILTFGHFLRSYFHEMPIFDHVNCHIVSKMTKIAIFDDFG